MTIPESVLHVCKTLKENGYKSFLVGGCVRDILLNIEPHDYDISTDATPENIKSIFNKVYTVGEKYGTIGVVYDSSIVEVTTFRKDGQYFDNRHPNNVIFSKDEKDDIMRRDFTINSLMYDPHENKILDLVNGMEDISNKIIKCIGNPEERFSEDYLRILRAIRFSLKYNFNIEKNTKSSIINNNNNINNICIERIFSELSKILVNPNKENSLDLLDSFGLLKILLPDIKNLQGVTQNSKYHPEGDVYVHTIKVLSYINDYSPETLGWAALLHDVGKPATLTIDDNGHEHFYGHEFVSAKMVETILKCFKASALMIESVKWLVKNHMKCHNFNKMKNCKKSKLLQSDLFPFLIELGYADSMGAFGNLEQIESMKQYKDDPIINNKIYKSKFLINGKDLIDLGFKPGPLFKDIIIDVKEKFLDDLISDRNNAIEYILTTYKE